MNSIKDFWDLDAWKKGHSFVVEIYNKSRLFPKEETYGLISQIRRSAASITANIAEGFSRYSFKDKVRFYYQARGSISETQNHLLLANSIGFINKESCQELVIKADEIRKLLNGLIRSTINNCR